MDTTKQSVRAVIQAEKLETRVLEMQAEYPTLTKMIDGVETELTARERDETILQWVVAEHEKTRYEKLRDEKISELSELYSELENDTLDMPGIRKLLLYLCNNAGIRPSEKVEDIDISLEKQ